MKLNHLSVIGSTLLSLSGCSDAVNIRAYSASRCGGGSWWRCNTWPEHLCCGFQNRDFWDETTTSVGVELLPECGIANWFSESVSNPAQKCMALKDSVYGSPAPLCMTTSGRADFGGGANWFHTVNAILEGRACPMEGTIKAASGIVNIFGLSLGSRGLGEDTMELTTEERAGILQEIYTRNPKLQCRGAGYATLTQETEDGGIWILEGSQENHRKYEVVRTQQPLLSHGDAIKLAGGTFYANASAAESSMMKRTLRERIDKGEFEPNDYINALADAEADFIKRGEPFEMDTHPIARQIAARYPANNNQLDVTETLPIVKRSDVEEGLDSFPWIESRSADQGETTFRTDSFPWIESRSENEEVIPAPDSFPWIERRSDNEKTTTTGKSSSDPKNLGEFPYPTYPDDYPFPEAIEAAQKLKDKVSKREELKNAPDSFPWIVSSEDRDEGVEN